MQKLKYKMNNGVYKATIEIDEATMMRLESLFEMYHNPLVSDWFHKSRIVKTRPLIKHLFLKGLAKELDECKEDLGLNEE